MKILSDHSVLSNQSIPSIIQFCQINNSSDIQFCQLSQFDLICQSNDSILTNCLVRSNQSTLPNQSVLSNQLVLLNFEWTYGCGKHRQVPVYRTFQIIDSATQKSDKQNPQSTTINKFDWNAHRHATATTGINFTFWQCLWSKLKQVWLQA